MNYDPIKLRALFGAAMNAQKEYTQNECQPKAWKTDEQGAKVARAYIKVNEDIDTYLKTGETVSYPKFQADDIRRIVREELERFDLVDQKDPR